MDQLSQILEFHGHLKATKVDTHKEVKGLFRQYFSKLIKASPEILKSTFLGTALFSCYDYLFPVISKNLTTNAQDRYLQPSFIISSAVISGSISGMLHGSLVYGWDSFFSFSSSYYSWIRKHPTLSMDKVLSLNSSRSLAGIIISHAFVHSVLFGSYESGKYIINTFISFSESLFQPSNNYKMNMSKENILTDISTDKYYYDIMKDVVIFGVSGALAGMSAEFVGYYTEPVERLGIQKGFPSIHSIKRPNIYMFFPFMLPSAVGFVAYELAKKS